METFKYYKRGEGELDTSNFPSIVGQGEITVDVLDEKTFFSLFVLNDYLIDYGYESSIGPKFPVNVRGYIYHMRGDKDVYWPAKVYDLLDNMLIRTEQIQHSNIATVTQPKLNKDTIYTDLGLTPWYTRFVGADGSVHKFMPDIDCESSKVRENGKVVSMKFDTKKVTDAKIDNVVIVDDILGGGKTVQMLVDIIRGSGYTGKLYLWVQYNEGIHPEDFTGQFDGVYLGDDI